MNTYHKKVWDECLSIVMDNVPSESYKTWFLPIVPIKLEGNVLTIQVPSPFFYEYLEEHYIDILRRTLRRVLGEAAKLEYSVVMYQRKGNNTTVNLPPREAETFLNGSTPPADSGLNPFALPGLRKINMNPQLNPSYCFENFVEGKSNMLARSAGLTVAQSPGESSYNPLVVYSASGLGKTHLAQAIGIKTKELYPQKNVLFVNAHKFLTQFTDAVQKNNVNNFINFYQMLNVLIIDDIYLLTGKTKTQDALFNIFNHLHQNKKQIVLTSDKAPSEVLGLEERLLSRFKWGLTAQIQTPEVETRMQILQRKMYRDGISIPTEVVHYLAEKVNTNIRELEGALVSILAQATHLKRPIDISVAQEAVKNIIKIVNHEVSINKIIKVVSEFYKVDINDLHSRSRKREIVIARQVAMFFAKKHTDLALTAIGNQIGKRDHSTVLHSEKAVKDLIATDKNFIRNIDEMEKKLFS